MAEAERQEVRRRRVLYIPGFDPVPARKYRERYRKGGEEQARISGYSLGIGPQRKGGFYGWSVEAEMAGQAVRSDVEVLVWADIVKDSMGHGVLATYWQLVRTAWAYIGSGALFRLMRLRKGPVIAALYPVVLLLGQLAVAVLAGAGAALIWMMISGWIFGPADFGFSPLFFTRAGMALVFGWVTVWLILRWFKRRDPWLAWYLMHDYAFSARHGGAYPPAQEARMRDFADRIAEVLAEEVDEVLVVGHSSGAYMAVSLLADVIRSGRVPSSS